MPFLALTGRIEMKYALLSVIMRGLHADYR
jgi:hypothetical protein